MVLPCHICGENVARNGAPTDGAKDGFECEDCSEVTCIDCKSIGVARKTDHCQRCRG